MNRTVLLVIALCARLVLPLSGFAGLASDSPPYLAMARGVIAGEGFVGTYGDLTAFRPPTYPVFLTGMLTLTRDSTFGVQLIQAVLAAMVAPLIFELLVGHIGRRRAFFAGLVFALDPSSIPTPAFILTEALGAVLLILFLSAWARVVRRGRLSAYLSTGVIAGILAYQTMITLLLHPIFSALAVLTRNANFRRALLSFLIFLLPLAAWTARNKIVLGEGTAVRSGGFGFLVWATVNYDFPWLLSPFDPRGTYVIRQESRVDAGNHDVFLKKALRRIEAEPVRSAIRIVKASFWAWTEVPGAMKSLDDRPLIKLGLRISNLLILGLALFGAKAAWRTTEGKLAIGIVLYLGCFLAPLWPIPRYFLPIRPMLAILAGFSFLKK